VDQALIQIRDLSLQAEVVHYHFYLEKHDDITLSCWQIAHTKLKNDKELLTTSRFLANAGGASRISTATLAELPLPVTITHHISPSPKPRPTCPQPGTLDVNPEDTATLIFLSRQYL
jgi:hypothetical protein